MSRPKEVRFASLQNAVRSPPGVSFGTATQCLSPGGSLRTLLPSPESLPGERYCRISLARLSVHVRYFFIASGRRLPASRVFASVWLMPHHVSKSKGPPSTVSPPRCGARHVAGVPIECLCNVGDEERATTGGWLHVPACVERQGTAPSAPERQTQGTHRGEGGDFEGLTLVGARPRLDRTHNHVGVDPRPNRVRCQVRTSERCCQGGEAVRCGHRAGQPGRLGRRRGRRLGRRGRPARSARRSQQRHYHNRHERPLGPTCPAGKTPPFAQPVTTLAPVQDTSPNSQADYPGTCSAPLFPRLPPSLPHTREHG